MADVDCHAQAPSMLDLPALLPGLWTAHGVAPPKPAPGAALRRRASLDAGGDRPTLEQVRNALSSNGRRLVGAAAGDGREGGAAACDAA